MSSPQKLNDDVARIILGDRYFFRGNRDFHYSKEAESSASTDWIHEGMTTKFGSASKEQKLPRAASSCAIG
jgi:hypothetical protein